MEVEMHKGEKGYFSYWLKNVLWYHYKYWLIGGTIALAVVVALTVDALKTVHYDFYVTVVSSKIDVSYNSLSEIESVMKSAVGDLNNDGKVLISFNIINLSDPEHMEDNQSRLQIALASEETSLIILDEDYSYSYCSREFYDDLNDYGIQPDSKFNSRISLSDTALFKRAGIADGKFYASLCDWTKSGKGSKKQTDAAVRALKALLSTQ
jgi:hypothetical protein